MVIADKLIGNIKSQLRINLGRTDDNVNGDDGLSHNYDLSLTDGSGTNQATGWCSEIITVTTGATTISLADSVDPFGALGDSVPTLDPEGLKLRAIMIHNRDDSNYVTVKKGTNGLTSWFSGATDSLRIPAGGVLLATFPKGLDTMNDGVDDEIVIQANTASVVVNISYLFGGGDINGCFKSKRSYD